MDAANPWLMAFIVSMATFMEVVDTSIANVALRHIAGSVGADQSESTWVLTSYLVSNAIVVPISGWLASVIGRKRFYMASVALFTLSSFACGLSFSLGMLLTCRVLQGIGGGGLAPSEQAILAGHLSTRATRDGFCRLRRRGRGRAGARTGAGRVDYRYLLMALDFLHQHSRGHRLRADDVVSGARIATAKKEHERATAQASRWITLGSPLSPLAWVPCRWSWTKARKTTGLAAALSPPSRS